MTNRTKITKTTFNTMTKIHSTQKTIMVQSLLKSGKWGKAFEAQRLYNESDEQVIERLTKLNNKAYRIAEN